MTDDPTSTEPSSERDAEPSFLRQAVETVITVAIAILLAQGVRAYVAEGYQTPTGSMVPTIETTDYTMFSKITYRFGTPRPGDIVTLDDPEGRLPMLMKRVIAVGGQTVDVREGRVWIDGAALDEPYTHGMRSEPLPGSSVAYPVKVPDGFVWVMGDNRPNSHDSRWFGPVPVSSVHGKAFFTYWPIARWGLPNGR